MKVKPKNLRPDITASAIAKMVEKARESGADSILVELEPPPDCDCSVLWVEVEP